MWLHALVGLVLIAGCGSSRSPAASPPPSPAAAPPVDASEASVEDLRHDVLTPTCVGGRMCVAALLDKCLDLCRRELVPTAITGGCEEDCRDDNCDARTCQ
jgi:hypothetical protein